jgi:hypothetical protein
MADPTGLHFERRKLMDFVFSSFRAKKNQVFFVFMSAQD